MSQMLLSCKYRHKTKNVRVTGGKGKIVITEAHLPFVLEWGGIGSAKRESYKIWLSFSQLLHHSNMEKINSISEQIKDPLILDHFPLNILYFLLSSYGDILIYSFPSVLLILPDFCFCFLQPRIIIICPFSLHWIGSKVRNESNIYTKIAQIRNFPGGPVL